MEFKLVSINVGQVQRERYHTKEIATGIYKMPTQEEVYVSSLQIGGDQQADLINHGGKDQAICAYSSEHFSYWEKMLNKPFMPGAFGENFTISGLNEKNACIGDVFEIGEAVIQISQPRQPCYKLGNKFNSEELPVLVQNTGYSGFYFRVLKEGFIKPEQNLRLVERNEKKITVSFVNTLKYHDKYNIEGLKKLVEINELSVRWRNVFQTRLNEYTEKHL